MISKSAPFHHSSSTPLAARHCLAFVCLASLALGAGCSASADIPEVVVTRSDVGFQGVPFIPGITDVTQTVSTTFDHPSDFELPETLNPELRPLSASVSGHGDLADLSFLEGLQVTLSSRAPGAPESRILAYYERPASGEAGRVLKLHTNVESDVLSYWDTDQAYYDVTLWGILPTEDWAIDVTFAFSGSISVSTSD
jgi:hypothetical protein